jgi:F-type H+-transporting ATPase subunit a
MNFSELIVHHLADAPLWGTGLLALTKHALMILIAAFLVSVLALGAAWGRGRAGRFLRVIVESVQEFLWKDIVKPAMGDAGKRFMPYFITLFLMILFMNLLGLVPFGASATGNISVTAALSLTTFCLIHLSGIREHGFFHHFGNLIPHGVPWPLRPFIFLLELSGYFTKALALCIRVSSRNLLRANSRRIILLHLPQLM